MKKFIILGAFSAILLAGAAPVTYAEETTPKTSAEKLTQIQDLMKLIADLQAKLAAARGEVKELMTDLEVGAQNDDVKKVQEILATDPSIFAGKATGYFGPMTEAGLKKLQERYGLEVTGKLDQPTRDLMKELRQERKNGMVPPGLVKSEEVKERIKTRLQEKWGDCDFEVKFRASVCEKVKEKVEDKKDNDDDDEESEVTRDDARRAVIDAQKQLNTFRESIDEMEDDNASEDEIDDALDTLREAQKEMVDARRALARRDFDSAYETAGEVLEILENEDEDSDEDDEDEDEDEDES
jgi:peptidoglycan hydrolase-like protein with peptidoglycan-binding domain